MNTKDIGNISEAALLTALAQAGYIVSIPWGDNARYDLVIDNDGILKRVQVKTGRVKDGCIKFRVCSSNIRTRITEDYHGQIDYFGVFVPELNKCYLVPVELSSYTAMFLRLEPPKNNQKKNVNWATGYEIGALTGKTND